jgi:hypothetical protein
MANNSFLIRNSATLNPQTSIPSSPTNGDLYYDASSKTFIFYDNGQWINLASRTDVPSATNLTSANFTAAVIQNSMVRITGSTLSALHGLTASTGGKQVIVYNQSTLNCTVKMQSATETNPANRIITSTGMDVVLASGMLGMFVYDDSQSRWICDTFQANQNAINTYPSLYVTSEADLTNALTLAITDGGAVICVLNPFTISSSHVIPANTMLLGRDKSSALTFLSGGQLIIGGQYAVIKDLNFTTALTSMTMILVQSDLFCLYNTLFDCSSTSSTNVYVEAQSNSSIYEGNVFKKTLSPATNTGIKFDFGYGDNISDKNFFTT